MASEFAPLKEIIPLTAIGHASLLRKLNPLQLLVYTMVYSLCFKGSAYKRMREISYIYVANELNRIYKLCVTKRQVRRSVDKIVKLGLIERKTASYLKQYGSQLLPTKTSYYRIVSP